MPAFQQGLTTAENLLAGAAKHHGTSSLLLSPVQGGINLLGKLFGKKDLGKRFIQEAIVAPSEKLTRSAKIFDHPVLGFPFKKKVTPEEIASAAQHYGDKVMPSQEVGRLIHKAQYGGMRSKEIAKLPSQSTSFFGKTKGFTPEQIQGIERAATEAGDLGIHSKNVGEILKTMESRGISLDPTQVAQLNKYIDWSKPYAHRLTAPFETVGKTMVLPMAGAMYMHEKLDRHQKEKAYKRLLQNKRRRQVANLSANPYNSYTMNKGGKAVSANDNEVLMKRADVHNAVQTIEELTKISQDKQNKIECLEKKELLYKEAANLIGQGLLDPTQMSVWVEQNASELTNDNSTKLAQVPSIFVSNEYAGLGSLAETSGSKGQHHQGGGESAKQVFSDFIFGGGSQYPGT